MGFVAICSAVYDYQPQQENELEIKEGELLYVLEKGADDDWWRARKKVDTEDEDEPEGLIPNNYVEDAKPTSRAKALYDYSRQTDEEVSFGEDSSLDVYDTSDPDWTLVGVNGEFGFAPANYIEISGAALQSASTAASRQVASAPEISGSAQPSSPGAVVSSPAANLARVLGGGTSTSPTASRGMSSPHVPQQQLTPDASDEEAEEAPPTLPQRPPSQALSPSTPQYAMIQDPEPPGVLPSPPYNRVSRGDSVGESARSPGGYHLYHVNEMVSALGKRKKMPTTLGLNVATGTIMVAPERLRDGPTQEWTAEKLQHYSIEGKHVFLDLVRPSKSLDLHAGAKDTAEEIVSTLGEIAGAQRGEGLREIIAAASGSGGQKKGQVSYDFMAQGDDEVTVAVGDEVVVLDDTKSEEWWHVRRLKNGKEGMVPSSYVEITGTIAIDLPSRTGVNAGKSLIEQNRLEEQRLAKEAVRSGPTVENGDRTNEVGPGMRLPERGSSLAEDDMRRTSTRDRRQSKSERKSAKSKPSPTKTRTWTDHSGSFKVEAQFIGMADGRIHLHKQNGVKIAVPVAKMSPEDLEYIEKQTGEPMDDYLPVAVLVDRKRRAAGSASQTAAGASLDGKPKVSEYDWFEFFLQAGVGPHQCERYAQAMVKDSMDESVLPDIDAGVLRTLGLKEGDVLKVMKYLDQKFNRGRSQSMVAESIGDGGMFAGPGGALYNNTRRGRPDANRQTSDVIDAKALQMADTNGEDRPTRRPTPPAGTSKPGRPQNSFDDDAWEVRPPAGAPRSAPSQEQQTTQPKPAPPTGAMADLSLLTPLQPTPAIPQPVVQPQQAPSISTQQTPIPPQQTGATSSFFSQLPAQPNGASTSQAQPQVSGLQPNSQFNAPRQRPQAPIQSFTGSALFSPPPRPMSAPTNQQQNFVPAPLQAQLTGIARPAPYGQSLEELNQQQLQQQYYQSQMRNQPTGYQQNFGPTAPQNGFVPQMTGFPQQQQQPFTNGNAYGSPFADPGRSFQAPQQTGFGNFQQQVPPPGGINSFLPPALQPQKTAYQQPQQQIQPSFQSLQRQQTGFPQQLQAQQTGYQPPLQPQQTAFQQQQGFGPQQNGFGNFQPPPIPPIPQQPTIAPLQPQKTGPAPEIRFGVAPAKKLTPQPTGRANLAKATPDNPFGF